MDRRTNALPDRPTDGPTDRPMDIASYRGALSHLKKEKKKEKDEYETSKNKKQDVQGVAAGIVEGERKTKLC